MSLVDNGKRFWAFLKKDTWGSWLVSLGLAFILIKFVFFPLLSFATGAPLPLVVVESCSMYHEKDFDAWWQSNDLWYENKGISKERFEEFPFKNGLNKGDIILVWGRGDYRVGDVVIFNSIFQHPLIHRSVNKNPLGTKGDHNPIQLEAEKVIDDGAYLGKAVGRVPGLGWLKLIFFEGTRPADERGFCT